MDAMLYSNKISQLLAINDKNIDIYTNIFLNCLVEINKQSRRTIKFFLLMDLKPSY